MGFAAANSESWPENCAISAGVSRVIAPYSPVKPGAALHRARAQAADALGDRRTGDGFDVRDRRFGAGW